MVEYGYGLVQIQSGLLYDFGTIVSITDSLDKSISSVPIVSLTTDSTFALESNTSNQFYISFKRRTPFRKNGTTYEDDANYLTRSWMWTNATWQQNVQTLINRWQARQGGYPMYINYVWNEQGTEIQKALVDGNWVTAKQTLLVPQVLKNIYIKSMSFRLSAGECDVISGSMQVVVGGLSTAKMETLPGASGQSDAQVQFKVVNALYDEDAEGS